MRFAIHPQGCAPDPLSPCATSCSALGAAALCAFPWLGCSERAQGLSRQSAPCRGRGPGPTSAQQNETTAAWADQVSLAYALGPAGTLLLVAPAVAASGGLLRGLGLVHSPARSATGMNAFGQAATAGWVCSHLLPALEGRGRALVALIHGGNS
jgi:hypothetical protein